MTSQSLQNFMLPGGGFGYQGLNIDDLTSFENTIATGLLDESGSTEPFARQMELAVKEIIRSLRHCSAADKLIYRHCHFDTNFKEVHGFKPLGDCHEDDYDGCWAGGGQTALYNSCDLVLRATLDYAEQQAAKRYMVNGFVYILTDGRNYLLSGKSLSEDDVKATLARCIASEALESLMTILIGVNNDPGIRRDLEAFQKHVGFSQFIPIEEANEKSLAKLANFVSQSIQSQSQALGSGGPSQSLTF
jgi:uncharacterized protein YegL